MSLLTRKHQNAGLAGLRGRALHTVRHAAPIAKNAGLATRHRARGAAGWAKPRVNQARSWAAPRMERAGLAVKDRIGPRVSDLMVSAAHRLEIKPSRSSRRRRFRRWPKRMAGSAMLAVIAAITVMATRSRANGTTSDSGNGNGKSGGADG